MCDNVTDLTAVMANILLDPEYARIDYSNRNFKQPIIAFIFTYLPKEMTSLGRKLPGLTKSFIFTYLPKEMTSLVLEVFSFTHTYVHYFEMVQLPDGTLQSSRFPRYTSDLLKVVNKFGWQNLFLVAVTEENDLFPYHVYYNFSIQELSKAQKCLQTLHLTPTQVAKMNQSLDETWLRGNPNTAIILFGRYEHTVKLYAKLKGLYHSIGLQILTHDFFNQRYNL